MECGCRTVAGTRRSLTASYVAAVGRRLVRRGGLRAINAAFPGNTTVNRNRDTSDYHALQLQFQQRLSSGLQALASYTWGHAIDTGSTDFGGSSFDQFNANTSRAAADFDIRHAFNAAVTYNIPASGFGSVGKAIFNNWSLDTIFTARTASPVDVETQAFRFTLGRFLSVRPNLNTGVPLYIDDPATAGGRRINPAAFTALPLTAFEHGTLSRNALRGFPAFQVDVALRRQFSLTERVKLQLRGEAFNILNHPNFGNPDSNTASATFGRSIQMLGRSLGGSGGGEGFNPLFQVGGPRSLQFALKLSF